MIAAQSPKLLKFAAKGSKLVAQRLNFTKKTLDKLSGPENGQRAYHYDTNVRGLAMAVSPAGRNLKRMRSDLEPRSAYCSLSRIGPT